MPVGKENIGVGCRRKPEFFGSRIVPSGPQRTLFLPRQGFLNLQLDALNAVAAMLGDRLPDAVTLATAARARLFGGGDSVRQLFQLPVEVRHSLFQQRLLFRRKPRPQRIAAGAQSLDFRGQRRPAIAILHQRRQKSDLKLRFQHQFVGAIEILIVGHQRVDAVLHRKRFQHVLAHEIRQIAHGFHRDGLVEQVHRLFVLDAETVAPGRRVRRKRLECLGPR